MITFTKAQIASILATGVDFGITFLLLRCFGVPGVVSGVTGTICGGMAHFMVSRNWVFNAQEGKWRSQLNRYVLVWTGNLILNVSGLWLLIHCAGMKAMAAKVIVATTVAVCYNFILQKRFVFK
ncbi:MAG TPA: GtrA family protein [Puia sp.]|nr:GtrA family protein [Puia sp.]